jgi:triacylglycerol lipase
VSTKYPIILAHGIAAKQLRVLNAFGRIGNELEAEGYKIYIADTDGFGSIENNAKQLKRFIEAVKITCECDKVNIIAHSKGGLDAKYMITHLGMEDSVASLTTLCTPHRGSIIASKIWELPMPIKKIYAWCIDHFYKYVFGDKNPDSMTVCKQLCNVDEGLETLGFSSEVYCQSYSSTLKSGKDCFIMALPMRLYKHFTGNDNDGMVSVESAKFGDYKGDCLGESISHLQIIDLLAKPKSRDDIYNFYISICKDLEEMGM